MIDAKKLFAAISHLPLSREKIFRRSFVCDVRIDGNIAQRVKAFCVLCFAPNQATTLDWIGLASVRDDVIEMYPSELDHDSGRLSILKDGDGGLSVV